MKCAALHAWICLLLVFRATSASQGTAAAEPSDPSFDERVAVEAVLSSTEQRLDNKRLRVDAKVIGCQTPQVIDVPLRVTMDTEIAFTVFGRKRRKRRCGSQQRWADSSSPGSGQRKN